MKSKNSFFYKYDSLVNNFFYFTLLRFFNIVTKFLLIAYLIRILGEKTFGLLTWSESILQYFVIIINFGFNIYGAKYVIKYKDNKDILDNIISSIYLIKGFFLIFSFLTLISFSFVDIINDNISILLLLLISSIGDLFFPIWYFQGIGKLKPLTIAVGVARFILLASTFLLVNSKQDLYLYIYIFSACQILMGLSGFYSLKKHSGFKFIFPKRRVLQTIFYKAKFYFWGNLSMIVFNALTIFLIGIYISMEKVAGFDISLKIVAFFLLPFEILQAAALPLITKTQNKILLKKLTYFSFLIGFVIFLCLNLFSHKLLFLLGGIEMTKYSAVLKSISLITLTVPVTFVLGQCGLVAFGQDKGYNYSLIKVAIFYLVVVFGLFFTDKISFNSLLYLRIFSDYLLLVMILIQIFKHKIFKFTLTKLW